MPSDPGIDWSPLRPQHTSPQILGYICGDTVRNTGKVRQTHFIHAGHDDLADDFAVDPLFKLGIVTIQPFLQMRSSNACKVVSSLPGMKPEMEVQLDGSMQEMGVARERRPYNYRVAVRCFLNGFPGD